MPKPNDKNQKLCAGSILKIQKKIIVPVSDIKKAPSFLSQKKLGTMQTKNTYSPLLSKTATVAKTYTSPALRIPRQLKRAAMATIHVALIAAIALATSYLAPLAAGTTTSWKAGVSIAMAQSWGSEQIEIWWPTDSATVSGSQPFKAILDNYNINDYHMYWQVDNGQKNEMSNSSQDYPHKEYQVDLSGWTWKGNGPYTLEFSAYDNNNQLLAQKFEVIYIGQSNSNSAAPQPTQTSQTTLANNNSTASSSQPPTSPAISTGTTSALPPSQPAPTPASTSVTTPVQSVQNHQLDVWWPVSGVAVYGIQPFKTMLHDVPVTNFNMFWQVDNGQLNAMGTSYQDYPHNETQVDLSGWNWKGSGPYTVTFIARDNNGQEIGRSTVNITVTGQTGGSATPAPAQLTSTTTYTPPAAVVPSQSGSNLFAGATLYRDPNNDPSRMANAIRSSDPYNAQLLDKIGNQPTTNWMGDWNSNIQGDTSNVMNAAAGQGALPVLVAYNIPLRDCGSYSAGGASSPDAYRQWINGMAAGIGNRKAVVILEPDGLSLMDCMSSADQQTRLNLLSGAVATFKALGNTAVYIDAGHPGWIDANTMASRLKQADIAQADGFALNISNFTTTSDNINYGQQISQQVGNKHFIIDTGRNGNGPTPDNQWCNPDGRALGQPPTVNTGNSLVDAYLWVKGPGGSDGTCNGGPSAGVFWPSYAEGLAQRASW